MLTLVRPALGSPEPLLTRHARRAGALLSRTVGDDSATHLAVLFIGIACVACLMPAQNDTWWHLRAGQDLWAGTSPYVDHYSYTAAGHEWLDREWLSQLLFFGLYSVGGLRALTFAIAAVAWLSLALTWAVMEGPPRKRLVLVALAFWAVTPEWSLRPQVFSLLLLSVTVWLLRRQKYALLPVTFLVWANLHGGIVIGLAILLVVTAVSALDAAADDRRQLATATVVSAAATLCTPLGSRLWTTMPAAIGRMHQAGVSEFQPPRLGDMSLIPFWLLLTAFVVLCVASRRSRSSERRLLAAALVTSGAALLSERNVAAAALLLVPAIDALSSRWNGRFAVPARTPRRLVNAALLATAGVGCVLVVGAAWTSPASRLGWQPMNAAVVQAVNACGGNLYNRFDDGGYLIWFTPERRVFADSRFDPYDDAFLGEHQRVEMSGEYQRLFSRYRVACAFLPPESPVGKRLVADGWALLYEDARWAVLRRPSDALN